ncbi:MAG: hypothetical protein ABSF28_15215 [Terracidiphilus sp.]|jgi:hypothetical protein
MRGVVQNADRQTARGSLTSARRVFLLFCAALFLGAVCLYSQCPDTGQTKVFKAGQGTGYYFYRFLGDSSFRYFLDGKTFSFNDKDYPGRTIVLIDDMAYESILEEKADFAKYIKGPKPIDILRAQAKYEQDSYKKRVPSVVITDIGPPSNQNPESSDERMFYLWKKENPPGMEVATQYLVSTLIKDRVVLLSIMLVKPTATQDDVFSQLEKYTANFSLISSDQCAKALAMPLTH